MKNSHELKLATYLDVPKLLIAAEKAYKESPYEGKIAYDATRAEDMILQLLSLGPEKAIIIYSENEDGEVIGILSAMITYTIAGLEKIALEVLWWVDKSARLSRLSIKFMQAMEYWARKLEVSKTIMGNMENEHASAVEKFYIRQGYTKAETTFIKILE